MCALDPVLGEWSGRLVMATWFSWSSSVRLAYGKGVPRAGDPPCQREAVRA